MKSVSPRRVLQWIHSGAIRASMVGGVYVIEESELVKPRLRGRPMGDKMAWAFVDLLSGVEPGLDSPTENSRLRRRHAALLADQEPASLLATWLRKRAERHRLSCQAGELEALRSDLRLALSGVSDARSGLSAAHEVEGYVQASVLDALIRDHLLIPATRPNVVLHVTNRLIRQPVPYGLVIADLAEYAAPREDAKVAQMLRRPHD